MNQNVQIPLEANSELCIQLESGGTSVWTIDNLISYGGSCIVYRATQMSGRFAGRKGIVKEFYPQSLSSISRQGGALVIPEEDKAEFEQKREHFFDGFSYREQFSALDSDHAMALPHIFGEANNTWYAVSDENTGCTLSDFDRRELSLNRAAQIVYSLCSAIGTLHERGYLYLDAKPDNANVYSLGLEGGSLGSDHIRLFDYDTVQSKKKLREAKYSTYSDGWAPPEQKAWRVKDISERTDIYSLGAVFFWLLTGRKPVGDTYTDESTENDIKRIKEHTFDWRKLPLCSDTSDGVISLLQRIFEKTLSTTVSARYDSVAKMKSDLSELINRTGGNLCTERLILRTHAQLASAIAESQRQNEAKIEKLREEVGKVVDSFADDRRRIFDTAHGKGPTGSQISYKAVHVASYGDLIAKGYTPLSIAESLVRNDYSLYPGQVVENEGTPEQWSQYLSSYPDTFRYIINQDNEIVGNWSFLAVSEEIHHKKLRSGELQETTFSTDETEFLLFEGEYIGYILNMSMNLGYNSFENINLLFRSFVEQILSFAHSGIFFKSWYVNVFRKDHEAMYKRMGFKYLIDNKSFGKVYEMTCCPYPKNTIFYNNKELRTLYEEHFQ